MDGRLFIEVSQNRSTPSTKPGAFSSLNNLLMRIYCKEDRVFAAALSILLTENWNIT